MLYQSAPRRFFWKLFQMDAPSGLCHLLFQSLTIPSPCSFAYCSTALRNSSVNGRITIGEGMGNPICSRIKVINPPGNCRCLDISIQIDAINTFDIQGYFIRQDFFYREHVHLSSYDYATDFHHFVKLVGLRRSFVRQLPAHVLLLRPILHVTAVMVTRDRWHFCFWGLCYGMIISVHVHDSTKLQAIQTIGSTPSNSEYSV